MGIAALVLGIVSVVLGFIPFCGIIALIPAIVGLVLGIIDIVNKKKNNSPRGKSIAGVICSAVAIVVILFYYFFFVLAARKASGELVDIVHQAASEIENSSELDLNYIFNYELDS